VGPTGRTIGGGDGVALGTAVAVGRGVVVGRGVAVGDGVSVGGRVGTGEDVGDIATTGVTDPGESVDGRGIGVGVITVAGTTDGRR